MTDGKCSGMIVNLQHPMLKGLCLTVLAASQKVPPEGLQAIIV